MPKSNKDIKNNLPRNWASIISKQTGVVPALVRMVKRGDRTDNHGILPMIKKLEELQKKKIQKKVQKLKL